MDRDFHNIVEKLAILEGRIAPKDEPQTNTSSKRQTPALFTNLRKKAEEDFTPMVGGVEFAEEKSQDVLSKVKASLQDYLKSAEESIKQDRDLVKKKKEDLDLKKKELKDLELQHREAEEELEENPNQTPATGEAQATSSNPTYAQGGTSTYASESSPVKTVNVPLDEMGGSVLVEFHGDESNGFCIRRAGRDLPSRFASLAEAELALEMYIARRKQQIKDTGNADYIEER